MNAPEKLFSVTALIFLSDSVTAAGIMVMAALAWGSSIWALHPPTPEQIEQYRKDGTLEERIRSAEALGNSKVDPGVAYDTQMRLRDLYEKSTGKRLNIPRQPPPAEKGGLQTAYPRSQVTTTAADRENIVKEVLSYYEQQGHDFAQYDDDNSL